jgi:site-specific DNA-cytosine methylase
MFDEQDRQYFYNEFKNNGYEVGSYDDFKKDLNNKEDRDWYYNEAKNMGYDVGTLEDFDKMVLELAPSTSGGAQQVAASATTQSTTQSASTETKPQVAQPAAKPAAEKPKEDNSSWFTKWMTGSLPEEEKPETADKEPGLIAKALGMIPTGVQTSNGTYQPAPEIPQPVVKGEEMPVKEEASPSSSANAASPESKEAAPVTTPTGVVNNEGLMDAKLANYLENWKQRPDKEGDYFENMVADLLADGTANSNEDAVKMVQSALGRYANRSAMDVTNQVVSSLPDDTVQDAEKSIEAKWYSHGVQDKLKQEADNMGISYDDYVGQFLKPAMVQSLVNKYGPNYRDIAEGIATRLYAHDEHVQDRLMNQDINDALSSVINKYVSPSVVDEYNKAQEAGSKAFAEGMEGSQFIPANLRLGTALGAQFEANEAKDPAKVLSGLQKKFGKLYRNPKFLNDMSNAAIKVMQRYGLNGTLGSDPKQFKPMINSVLKNELDQLEVKGMIPRGSADYILKTGLGNTIVGKITRKAVQTDYQNWLEDMANQQYQPGFWENVASGALTFAGDAWSYWLPGAAGGKLTKSMLAKAEGKLAGDLMAKGMESRMAARAAKLLIGKSKAEALKSGAVHGAVTFGGQSAISKPIDEVYRTGQFDENGKIYNPSVGKVIADTLGEVAKQTAVGAIMQGGTIANMVGKGRGLATNILADIGGKVADSGIMTGHQMLERMAQDPNFKPTGKDAAESFLESMANLTAIGLPGMVGKYARFKDAREFNKKFDFTDQDIAELKRFGYEDLRDAFEKVGIGEYAVEGENAQRLEGQLTQKYMNLMNDKSVPEVLKAKMMAVVEGKRPSSFSPVVDSVIVQPMDNGGKVYLETLNKDGGIIERKEYSSLDDAQKADKKLEYEKTLGLASVLEGEFHNEFTQEHLDGLYNQAAQKYNMGEKLTDEDKAAVYLHQNAGAIKDIMDKQQKGIILTEEEQKQVDTYRHFYNSALENSSVMREFVNTFEDSHGVARGTLRKALESKDKKYAPLVESYLKELYNSIELKREMKQTMDDLYNTAHGNEQKQIEQSGIEGEKPAAPVEGAASVEGAAPVEGTSSVEGAAGGQEPSVSERPAPYQDRTNSVPSPSDANSAANVANSAVEVASSEPKVATSDAFVMGQEAYKNGDSGTLKAIDYNSDLATGRLKRAFADSDTMFDLVTKAYNEGRDMEQFVAQRAGNLTPAQKEAISKYVEAMDAKKGAIDALQHADDGYGEALKEQLWPYQTEDGNIVPATLTSGKQVFLKKANEYGGGFVVVPDEQGQPTIKQVSNAEIKEVGTPVSLDEYIEKAVAQQKDARNKQFLGQFNGAKKGDIVSVYPEGADSPKDLKIAGYTKDGKVVLTDVDVDVNSSIDPNKLVYASKEEFETWRKNALENTINERLDREDDEREQKAVSQAEVDKQERYKKGIFGYAAGQPDYSDTQTDPKVAAEYLQETAGEDRKALFANIVAEKQALQKRINQLREHIASNEEWLSINADLDPKNAETRTLANKQMEGQIADLQARFDNWNKIRSAVMTPEEAQAIKADRTQKIADAGVNEGDVAPIEGREVAVFSDEELKKQYPTMDEASDFIASERKRIYRIQSDEVQREIDGVDEVLDRYVNGEIDLEPEQIKELNTTKAQLQARQANLTESAKELKAQADKLKTLYRKENMEARAKAVEDMTPAEQRAIKVENAIKNGNMNQLNSIYEDVRGATDFNDTEPNTLEEYVANNIGRFTLNYEGKEKGGAFSNGIQQETGLGRKDFEKLQILAKEGEGKTVPEFVHSLYDDMPMNLKQMGYTDHDIRSAFLDLIGSAQSYSDIKNYTLNNKVANVEQLMRDVERQEEEMKENGTHSEAFDKIVELAKEQKEYWDLMEQGEVDPDDVPEVDVAYDMDELLKTLSDEEFKEVSDVLKGIDEEFEYFTADEYERREGANERKKKVENANTYDESIKEALKPVTPFAYSLKSAVESGDKKAVKKAQKELTDALIASDLGHDYLSGQLAQAKLAKKKDELYKVKRATVKPLTDAIRAIESDENIENASFADRLKNAIAETEAEPTEAQKAKETDEALPFDAPMNMDDLPFHRDVKEVKSSEMTEAQKVAYDAVSTMLKKAGIPVKVVSNEDMEKVAEAQDNLNLAMLLNQPEMRFKIKTPEEKKAAENAYNFAKDLRPNKWAQYAVVDMSNPNKMPEYYQKQELARKERTYLNRLMWGNYKVFNLDKSFEDNVAGLTGSFPSEFDPYKIDAQTSKKDELKKQIKETEEAYKLTGQERKEYQNQLMKEYMDEHRLASENDIPDDVWREFDYKAIEKYQDKLDSLFARYKDLDRQLKAIVQPGVRFLRTYHGTGASFSEFDFDHMGEGEGSQAFGWGGYVTSSKKIGKNYATLMDNDPSRAYYRIQHSNGTRFAKKYPTLESFLHGDKQIAMNDKFTEQEKIDYYNEMKKLAEPYHNLYEVDIPDDNGSNYLDWDKPLSKKQQDAIREGLEHLGVDIKKLESKGQSLERTGENVYNSTLYIGLTGTEYDLPEITKGISKFLSSVGFTGIKFKAGRNFGGAKKGDTNYVIFKPEDMKIVDRTKFAQNKGVVYGYTDGKEIVLNQEHLNPNTPIHEYQHLWRTAAKEMNPELIAHGDELIKQTQLFRDLKEDLNYKHLSDDEICDEAFARLTGEDGAAILEQMAKDAIKENPLDTAKELTIINRLKNWLKKFWYWTLDTFTKWKPEDIKKMTLEDIRNLVLRDLANGVDPRNVKSRMTKEDAVSLRKQMEDNAEQERILEHTEENWQKEFGKDSRVTTPIGSIKLGENQYKKAGRNDRIKRFGLLKPTLERPDVILEKSAPKEGAERQTKYLFIKSFKKADGNKILNYESITVKQGEEEVAISAHQIEPSKVVKELTESRVLWNRFRGDSNSLGENQGSALTPSANNPSGKDSVLNPHSDAKIRNNIETAKGNGGNLSVEDKIKAVSQQFGVDEADVAMYANAVKKGSTAEAARARANIKRYLLQANEDKISSFKDIIKYTKPVNEALKENFGDLDAMIEERVKQVEAQRNAMEAARKRAEEEEAKRQKHLEELSVIPDDQLDKQYMDALAKGDDATAREMLDEAARRKGYDDTESAYQGVGAWAAPGNPGYESDKARRDDWESSGSDVNLEDIALGYAPQPDDYFSHPERYSQNTPHGLESVKAINTAIDAIKNGEKDVKVKVYRAVPTSVKEGKLRNGDWVTPSKKYAEMHGTNRLEGKYRIIEDEVPATQLWWDGNDANEFGFDDGKAYKYKNAKNNRKLNDLVTYDDEGDVIPPSKRFNSRKKDIRFMFAGEKGAAEADKAEEKTYRMDNLKVAEKMERGKKDAKAIKLATGWERGADGKWRYEMPDAKIKDMKDIGGGNIVKRFDDDMLWNDGKLTNVIDAPGLFEAYPQLKDVRIDTDAIMNDMPSNGNYNAKTNTITIHADELKYMNSILNHEIQHAIQYIEGFGKGGSPEQMEKEFKAAQDEWKARAYAHELEEKAKEMGGEYNQSEVEKALVEEYKDLDMSDELPDKETRIKGFNYFARGYADRSMDDTIKRFRLNESTRSDFDSYKEYLKLAGEVESRNVEKRLGMNDEERRNSLAEETEDVPRDSQIVSGNARASYKIVEQKLQKHPDSLMKAGTYFSGGGLVEEGLKGIIDPVVAVEYDRKISGVYRNNFGQHIVTADVRDVDPKELVKHIDGEVEYFHASPVCKNYSQAKSNSGEVELDKETAKSTADFIDAVKPRVVTIENVKGYKDSEAMKIITKALDQNGYTWDADVYNAADFGGYTSRERLIVRAVKDGELPEKPKKQPRKSGWLEAVEDILPTLTVKESGVAPWMDARLKADGIDWKKVEKPLYVMGSAYADGKIPHAYGDEILPTLRTKSGDVIIMPGGKVLRADGRVLARITGLGDDYLLPKTESLAHTIIGNGIPVQLTQGVIAPLLNKDDLSGRNVLARLGKSIFKNDWDADKQKKVSDQVVNTANKLGGAEATVYTSVDEVPDAYLSDVKNGATGWYDPTTHTVHVYLPNCADANEAERTVLHEKIGHEGMEVLLGGEDEVRKFANFVYNSVAASTRGKILEIANEYDPDWKKHDRMNVGTQEYIARLAEEGPKTAEDFSLWTKIKHYLIKVLKKLGIRVPGLLNDKDLRYYLMKAGKALHVWDEMPQEKQEAMMKQASNAEIKDALSDGAGKGKPRQKKGESMIQYMKRVQEWRKWKNAREDENDPEPPMFYDIDKDEAGKKEWAQLNKDWRERHHLAGEEPTGLPIRMEGEEDGAYMTRIHEYEKWKDAMKDQKDPMPDMFAFEKKKQEVVKRKYEDWLARHELLEQQQADLDLYEGKIYPAETNPKADDLEQQVMQDLAEVTSTDVSKEGAAKTVKHAVIHRRKNMEEASADDAIYINDVKNRIEKMADSGAFDKLLSDYQGKPNRAEKLAEAIPYIIEAPRRLRDLAHDLNATGAFDKGHIHIQPADVEAIQPYVADLIAETGKKHTELRDGKEVEVYDDPQAVSDVASKMAQVINDNHQGEEGFVPIDGTDILSEHVLPLVKQQIVPEGIDYKNISPEMKAAIDSIRDWYNYTYDWLKDNRTLKEDTGYNVDYVNHIWDKEKSDKQAYALYVENRQRTKSPNEKKRTISTLMEGISVGLVPKTTDITKMMAYYSRSNIEAWVNKTMLQELSGLNVIERNEDGEVVSTDPLLSSSAPFNLEQYQYFEIPGVGPVWVYNVSPKQVKVKNPITGKERVLYSEASAGDRFGVVFETYQSSPFWKAFDTLASSAKKLELGFSGFHAGALTEVYMVQNMVEFGPKKAMANFMKYIFVDTAKNHELPCFANPQDFQEAASHLVKFGATNDYAAADVQNMFDNMRDAMMKVQEKLRDGNGISGTVAVATMPLKVVTQLLSLVNKGMDRALWDFLHDGLKLATYRMRADKTKERAKEKGWSAEELSRALDEDGQFVNDMFGGQHWDVLGASHRTLRYAGRVLLSPDWNASTTRHFLALTGFGSIWNEATFENFKQYYQRLWNKELIPEDEGRRGRQISALLCYGIGFMVFYEAIANGINAAFRALDEEKERKKAEEIRKTNPSYKSMYELAYGDEGMKWYDYLMRGNSLGQQSKIFMGRYEDGTEMYIRHGKQFREVPEYLFNHKGELEFPGPMVQRMIGKANPMVRMTLDDINYLSDFQASHADQEIQRKYGKTIGLLYKDALYWAPFLIPSQENKEFKAVDFFFPSSKGFSPWKAQSYFKDFILSGDMEGVVMTYQSCQRNGIDAEAQIKAAIGSVKALESAEMNDGVTSLQVACQRFDAAKSITEKKKMRQKMKKFLSQSDYKAFTQKEALDMVQDYLNGDEDLKEMEKAESKYLMAAKAEDVTEDWRIQNVWNGTMETYQEYQRLKDIDKAKANAFKNSKTNKRLFVARKAISAAKKKMNKAKKQMDGSNGAAKMVEIRKTRKELLNTLNGME